MEARAVGEENRGEGENRGKGKKKCGEGRRGEGRRVFRRSEAAVGSAGFRKAQKPALVVPALEFLKKWRNRRWECRLQKF